MKEPPDHEAGNQAVKLDVGVVAIASKLLRERFRVRRVTGLREDK